VCGAEAADARERFSRAAGLYARCRPGYPSALVDWILGEAGLTPGARVVDVGCGTGIFSRLLDEHGLDVIGLDPNADMLAEARARGGARYLRAEAAATALAGRSVALVAVAQAFHWFSLEAALAEFARVLAPGGHVAAVYNLRADSPFMREYDALLRRFSGEYSLREGWEQTLAAIARDPRVRSPRRIELPHEQRFDEDGLLGRARSSSYVFRGVRDADGFEAELRALHARHAVEGVVRYPYRSTALVFCLEPAPARAG
jgi:SAM-dependent methyltransferase